MILFADKQRFIPLGADALITQDGALVYSRQIRGVKRLTLQRTELTRVQLGDGLVYDAAPKSYFYLQLID